MDAMAVKAAPVPTGGAGEGRASAAKAGAAGAQPAQAGDVFAALLALLEGGVVLPDGAAVGGEASVEGAPVADEDAPETDEDGNELAGALGIAGLAELRLLLGGREAAVPPLAGAAGALQAVADEAGAGAGAAGGEGGGAELLLPEVVMASDELVQDLALGLAERFEGTDLSSAGPGANTGPSMVTSTSPSTSTVPTTPVVPVMPIDGPDVVRQVVDGIRLSTDTGIQTAEVRLSPDELGSVKVRLEVEGQSVRVFVTTETAGARDAVAAGLDKLRQDLLAQGLHTSHVEVRHQVADQGTNRERRHDGTEDGAGFAEEQFEEAVVKPAAVRRGPGRLYVTA